MRRKTYSHRKGVGLLCPHTPRQVECNSFNLKMFSTKVYLLRIQFQFRICFLYIRFTGNMLFMNTTEEITNRTSMNDINQLLNALKQRNCVQLILLTSLILD